MLNKLKIGATKEQLKAIERYEAVPNKPEGWVPYLVEYKCGCVDVHQSANGKKIDIFKEKTASEKCLDCMMKGWK